MLGPKKKSRFIVMFRHLLSSFFLVWDTHTHDSLVICWHLPCEGHVIYGVMFTCFGGWDLQFCWCLPCHLHCHVPPFSSQQLKALGSIGSGVAHGACCWGYHLGIFTYIYIYTYTYLFLGGGGGWLNRQTPVCACLHCRLPPLFVFRFRARRLTDVSIFGVAPAPN